MAVTSPASPMAYTHLENGLLKETGHTVDIACDQILTAIGQTLDIAGLDTIKVEKGKIVIDEEGRTSVAGVWAGGDCATGGEDLTVSAVAMGRDAAMSIIKSLA